MEPEELKEMETGGIPYSPQQNEAAEAKKSQPKPIVQVKNNGEKLYKKCPTCGGFMEASSVMTQSQPLISQQHQMINGRIVNHLIHPIPQEIHQPRPDRNTSDEKTMDGTPVVDAHWNTDTQRIPQTPLR